jgi:hypothetical protein
VEQCLRDLAKGRTLCTPGWIYRTVVGTLEMPRRSLRAAAKLAGRGRGQRRAKADSQSFTTSTPSVHSVG